MKAVLYWLAALLMWVLVVFIIWLGVSNRGLQWVYQLSTPYLPAELHIGQVDGRIVGPIVLTGVHYQASDGNRFNSEQLTLDWNPWSLLEGRVDIQSILINTLLIEKSDTAVVEATAASAEIITLPDINLPLPLRLQKLQVQNINLTQGARTLHFTQLELSGSTLFNQVTINQLMLKGESFEITTSGEIRLAGKYRHDLKLNWRHQLSEHRGLHGQGRLTGNLLSTKLNHTIDGLVRMDLQAELSNVLDNLEWQSSLDVKQFDSRDFDFVEALSGMPSLSGQLKLSSSGNLQKQQLNGQFSGKNSDLGPFKSSFDINRSSDNLIKIKQFSLTSRQTKTRLEAVGDWQPDKDFGQLNLALNWQHLQWPQKGVSWFNSASGKARFNGNPGNYRINLETDRPFQQIPASQWTLTAQGNQQGMNIESLTIKTLEGKFNASGKLDWASFFNWDADIQAVAINPGAEWPEWPGLISGKVKTQGSYQQNKLAIKAELVGLEGRLRDYPVSLNGKLKWQDERLLIDQVRLKSASSQVTLQGQFADKLALDWSINSPNLAELYPAASGVLNANGLISGSRQQPALKTDFSATDLRWNEIKVGSAKGSARLDLQQWYEAHIMLKAQDITAGGVHLTSADISTQAETITLNVVVDQQRADIKLKGRVKGNQWQGQLLSADLSSDRFSNWHLQAPAQLVLASDSFKAEQLCWKSDQLASVCSHLQQLDKRIQAEFEMKRVPLSLLKQWLPDDVRPEGEMNADARLTLLDEQKVHGNIHLTLAEGVVHYPVADSEVENWPYRNGEIDIDLTDKGIQLKSTLEVNQHDSLNIKLWLPQARLLKLDRQHSLEASAQLNIVDLRLLGALIPEVQNAEGEIKLSLQANGTLDRPVLKGYANLEKGRFKIPRLGLDIYRLSLVSQTDDFEKLNFELRAHSGEGDIVAKGYAGLNYGTNWKSEFKVTGKDFEVSKIPEARVRVSPELTITMQPKIIQLKGKVHVPYARLNPKDISTAAQVSDDVVIIGAEQQKEQKWLISSEVRLTLDEKHVQFYGFGFEGYIGGSVLLEDSPGQLTRATGDIRVPEGRYRAYGQRLSIENGRLLFTGGPVTNPGLDFRAVRVVNDVTAGLKVSGSLKQPQLDIFSIPAMGQTDALSYLILGRPMESSSNEDGQLVAKAALAIGLSGGDRIARMLGDELGLDEVRVESNEGGDQASLVVGRYLSPKLYITYGVGLIEPINTFGLRYQLSSKWQLKAESGEAQGADLLYTIER